MENGAQIPVDYSSEIIKSVTIPGYKTITKTPSVWMLQAEQVSIAKALSAQKKGE